MPHLPRVVVGCDNTPASDAALRFAADEARLRGGVLVVVAAFDGPIDPDLDDYDIPLDDLHTAAADAAVASLQRALAVPANDLPRHDIVTVEGDPGRAVLAQAADAVLLVIGTHNRSLLQRLLSRGTATELLAASTIPVAIIPSPER